MSKNTCVVYAPVQCYAGYGARARDIVYALVEAKGDEWDIKVIPCNWGNTRRTFIKDNYEDWGWLEDHFIQQLNYQPDYMFWITVPNEAQKVGKWNCVITAGIETTVCAPQWIEGCNRMDLVLTSSTHSKSVFENSQFQMQNKQTQQSQILKLTTPVEVLFEGLDLFTYRSLNKTEFKNKELKSTLDSIPEDYAFLFVGHWLPGDIGEDRKNVGLLIKAFYELFKNVKNKPALILKTSISTTSNLDRREVLKRISQIRSFIEKDKDLPNVYLLHGDFDDESINEIYNHRKVKTMISLTKGEGFGRPLLEFSATGKPIIATNFSGHTDFLKHSTLLPGQLTDIHPSAQVKDMLIEGSKWFSVDLQNLSSIMTDVWKNYKIYKKKALKQRSYSKANFNLTKMVDKLDDILDKNAPKIAKQVELKLPKLNNLELPKLEKA